MKIPSLKAQLSEIYSKTNVIIYLIVITCLFATLIISKVTGLHVRVFMDDLISLTHAKFYTGLFTHIGVFIWIVGGTIAMFGYFISQERLALKIRNFLLVGGLISYMFGFDDLLTIHENVGFVLAPTLGISQGKAEALFFLLYWIVLAVYLWTYRLFIIEQTDFIFLVLTFGFWGASIVIDLHIISFESISSTFNYWIEESTKFLGITNWAIYYYRTAKKFILNVNL
jgi:hypothetical protein